MAYFKNVELDREDFDTEEDYNRALIEQDRIEKINHNVDITDPVVAKTLLDGFLKHPDMFHTIVGTEFLEVLRENTKELMEQAKRTKLDTDIEQEEVPADTTTEEATQEETPEEVVTSEEAAAEETAPTEEVPTEEFTSPEEATRSESVPEAAATAESGEETVENEVTKVEEPVEEAETPKTEEPVLEESAKEPVEEPEALITEESVLDEPVVNESDDKDETVDTAEKADTTAGQQEMSEAVAAEPESAEIATEELEKSETKVPESMKQPESEHIDVNSTDVGNGKESSSNSQQESKETATEVSKNEKKEKKLEFYLPVLSDGRIRLLLALYILISVSFPIAGCICAVCLLIVALLHTLYYYWKHGLGAGRLCVTVLCILVYPVGIVLSIIGCMKKVKYVVLNHKLILYGFCLYLIPMMLYFNLSMFSRSAGICIYPWLASMFIQGSMVSRAAMICNMLFLIGLCLYLILRYMGRIMTELHEVERKKTTVQPVLILLDLPIVVLCMFLSFMKVNMMEEEQLS